MITKNVIVQTVWESLKNKINRMIMFMKNFGNNLGVVLGGTAKLRNQFNLER